MKILIGVDGSNHSDATLGEVSQRTWPHGSEILVVNAFEIPLAPTAGVWAIPSDYYVKLDRIIRVQSDAVLKAAEKQLRSSLGDRVEIKTKAVQGSPKRVILDEADSFNADLIVVGHGCPTWERLLLGSVSQAVVLHAKCSVEVVRLPIEKKMAA